MKKLRRGMPGTGGRWQAARKNAAQARRQRRRLRRHKRMAVFGTRQFRAAAARRSEERDAAFQTLADHARRIFPQGGHDGKTAAAAQIGARLSGVHAGMEHEPQALPCQGREPRGHLRRGVAALPAEKGHLPPRQKGGRQRMERFAEHAQPLALFKASEKDKFPGGAAPSPAAGRRASPAGGEVGDHRGARGQTPAAIAHPAQKILARADKKVRLFATLPLHDVKRGPGARRGHPAIALVHPQGAPVGHHAAEGMAAPAAPLAEEAPGVGHEFMEKIAIVPGAAQRGAGGAAAPHGIAQKQPQRRDDRAKRHAAAPQGAGKPPQARMRAPGIVHGHPMPGAPGESVAKVARRRADAAVAGKRRKFAGDDGDIHQSRHRLRKRSANMHSR